jgi:hypothetical protein
MMKTMKLFAILVLISLVGNPKVLVAQQVAQPSMNKKLILIDIGHNQKFWNDPANMNGKDPNQIKRVKYMTSEITKTASSLDAEIGYLQDEMKPDRLAKCDLLFIHIPSSKFRKGEIGTISQYLQNGGSLFLVMDEDYWSTLEQTDVNDLIKPFGIQYGTQSPDTINGGYTKEGLITNKPLKITYSGGRIIKGGTPFCFNNQTTEFPFGVFTTLKNGGRMIVMGDGMVSLYMTGWKGVNDYQCGEFMHDAFKWLLDKK